MRLSRLGELRNRGLAHQLATAFNWAAVGTYCDAVTVSTRPVPFSSLADADLVLDCTYEGGARGNAGDDPLAALLPVGNQGGFRYAGSPKKDSVRLSVLYTSGAETDWPDWLDPTTGDFTYYGDNRRPGSLLLRTPRGGNLLLQKTFDRSHRGPNARRVVPPYLLFGKSGNRRDVIFRGLLAPGSKRLSPEEELVAVWRTTSEHRFQNYRAHFTVLDVSTVTREWLVQILAGDPLGSACPHGWRQWVDSRTFTPLEAPRSLSIRTPPEQLPITDLGMDILHTIHRYFGENPYRFEHFAADLYLMSDKQVSSVDVTRPTRDGGRDAVGEYLIGPKSDPIRIEFAMEAKCYAPNSGVGVRHASRLISRLKHRQFGVLLTTSYLDRQAYSEIRADEHPVVVISGADIVEILSNAGYRTASAVLNYLQINHPLQESPPTTSIDLGTLAGVDLQLVDEQGASEPEDRGSEVSLSQLGRRPI